MARKQRPTLVDEFRQQLTPEQDDELLRIAALPNVAVPEVYNWLLAQGFKGSLSATYTWFGNHQRVGEKARAFNELLKDYDGVATERVLQKLLIVLSEQVDVALTNVANAESPLNPNEYLRQIPNLGRELRSTIQAINQLQAIRDRKGLEIAGAMRLAQELRLCFADTPFAESLDEAIKGAMTLIEEDG